MSQARPVCPAKSKHRGCTHRSYCSSVRLWPEGGGGLIAFEILAPNLENMLNYYVPLSYKEVSSCYKISHCINVINISVCEESNEIPV